MPCGKCPWLMVGGLALLALLSRPGLLAAQQVDPERGRALAREVCANCHVVEAGGRGTDAVPSFQSIVARPGVTDAQLRGFIADPHPRMPDLQLTNSQIEDIVSYLDSLR